MFSGGNSRNRNSPAERDRSLITCAADEQLKKL
jgi:hypothetical protein